MAAPTDTKDLREIAALSLGTLTEAGLAGTDYVGVWRGSAGSATLGEINVADLVDYVEANSSLQAQGDVLDDLNTLGASTGDGEFLVATGAGALAWESGATALTSLGVTAFAQTILDDANEAAFKATVNLEIGTDVAGITGSQSANYVAVFDSDGVIDGTGNLLWNNSAGLLSLEEDNNGNAAGPTIRLTRNSTTPADDDALGELDFVGKNDAGSPEDITYAVIQAEIEDFTDGTEDGRIAFHTNVAGTVTERMTLDSEGLDLKGNQVEGFTNKVLTASGALTVAAHSGNVIVTSGNVTVPSAAGSKGFTCTLIAGGAHTVSFNSTTSAAMAAGDLMAVVVEDDASGTPTIHAVLTEAADKVSFS